MKKLWMLAVALGLLAACDKKEEDSLTLNSRFVGTWNIYESIEHHFDGSITYHALPWGGMVGVVKERNMPVDWSDYESLVVEFAEPTTVDTQIKVSNKLRTWGKKGITTLTCSFDGQDMTSIDEITLQARDSATIRVSRVYLTSGKVVWNSTPIWEGRCEFGDWGEGISIKAEHFTEAHAGDKLEFLLTTADGPGVNYWNMKTIYAGTDVPLEGNSSELNEWGCAMVGEGATSYRVVLTQKDIKELRKHGLYVSGFYCNVKQCNLLRKSVVDAPKKTEEQ